MYINYYTWYYPPSSMYLFVCPIVCTTLCFGTSVYVKRSADNWKAIIPFSLSQVPYQVHLISNYVPYYKNRHGPFVNELLDVHICKTSCIAFTGAYSLWVAGGLWPARLAVFKSLVRVFTTLVPEPHWHLTVKTIPHHQRHQNLTLSSE